MSKMRILVAEDNPQHQLLLKSLLKPLASEDALLEIVSSGREAKEAINHTRFDCLVLDFRLPDITADTFLQEVSEQLLEVGCPVIVISSSRDQTVAVASFRNGSIDFLPKREAFTPGCLWSRIRQAIGKCRRVRQERREDIRERSELRRLAETDQLTGLFNRRFLEAGLARGDFRRDRRKKTTCAFIDIDHFKKINDTHGHSVGDQVLKSTAQAISRSLPGGAVAIRWGGEEFVVLQTSTSLGDTWMWADGLRKLIRQEVLEGVGAQGGPYRQHRHHVLPDVADQY